MNAMPPTRAVCLLMCPRAYCLACAQARKVVASAERATHVSHRGIGDGLKAEGKRRAAEYKRLERHDSRGLLSKRWSAVLDAACRRGPTSPTAPMAPTEGASAESPSRSERVEIRRRRTRVSLEVASPRVASQVACRKLLSRQLSEQSEGEPPQSDAAADRSRPQLPSSPGRGPPSKSDLWRSLPQASVAKLLTSDLQQPG